MGIRLESGSRLLTGDGGALLLEGSAGAPVYVNDNFTGVVTALENHMPDTGGAYSLLNGGAGSLALDGSGHLGISSPTVENHDISYVNDTQTFSADVQISFTILTNSGNTGRDFIGVIARYQPSSSYHYFIVYAWDQPIGYGQWVFIANTSVGNTILKVYPAYYPDNTVVNCIYRIIGTTHSLYINDFLLTTYDDSSITSAGLAGVFFALQSSGSNNFQLDSWTVIAPVLSTPSITQGVTESSYDMTMTGFGTSWTSGTTFSVTGGTGAGISNLSINVSTQVASFTLATGSTAGTLTIGNSSDSSTAAISVLTPAAQIDQIAIGPTGNFIVLHCADLSNSPTVITSYSGGITIQINGGTPITLDPSMAPIAFGCSWMWYGLNDRCEVIVDDSDAGFATTGTWDSVTPNPHWASMTGVWFKGNRHTTSVSTATATYTFTGVVPGAPYRVAFNGPIDEPGQGVYCTRAVYTVRDGSTVIGTFTANQDTVSILEFDWCDGNDGTSHFSHFYNLGTTATVTGTTLTVTLSNGVGSGTLVADAVRIERLISLSQGGIPIVHPGDVVTLTAPGGCILTSAGFTEQVVNAPVTLWTDAVLFPYDSAHVNTMQIGYNICGLGPDDLSTPMYSNRLRACQLFNFSQSYWRLTTQSSGTFTTDDAGQLTGTTAGCQAYISVSIGVTSRVDIFTLPIYSRSGTWTLICKTTGNPTLMLSDIGSGFLLFSPPTFQQVATFTDSMGTWTVYTQDMYIGSTTLYNSDYLILKMTSAAGGDYIRFPQLYGPELYSTLVASNWAFPPKFHPNTLDWLKGRNLASLRILDHGQSQSDFGDIVVRFTVAEGTFDARIGVINNSRTPYANVVSVEPIDTNPATDADGAYTLFAPQDSPNPIVKITTSTPHGMYSGSQIALSNLSGYQYNEIYGGTINWDSCRMTVAVSPTVILATFYTASTTQKPSNLLTTITTSVNPGGIVYIRQIGDGFPWDDFIDLCNECNVGPHICIGAIETDDCVNKRFQYAAAHLNPGIKLRAEWSNEIWNDYSYVPGTGLSTLYSYTKFGSRDRYYGYAYISCRMRSIAWAGWTGVPAVFIDGDGIGAVAHATVADGAVTGIVIDNGGGSYTTATISIIGGAGSGASATATISGGAVTGVTSLVGGSGYTITGRVKNDLNWVMNVAYGNNHYIQIIGDYCNSHNLIDPFEIGLAPYQGNTPPSYNWADNGIASNAFSRLDIDGLIDLYGVCMGGPFRDGNGLRFPAYHAAAIASRGFNAIASPTANLAENQTRVMGYEGGPDFLCPFGTGDNSHLILRSVAMSHHRRMRLATRSYYQNILQAGGFTLVHRFQLSDLPETGGAVWTDKETWNMDVGTADGTDGKYDNANPFQYDRVVSPMGYALREFANPPTTRRLYIQNASNNVLTIGVS